MSMRDLLCDCCGELRRFEQPPCADPHGTDCPDWICTSCGTALVIAPTIMLIERTKPVVVRRRAA